MATLLYRFYGSYYSLANIDIIKKKFKHIIYYIICLEALDEIQGLK